MKAARAEGDAQPPPAWVTYSFYFLHLANLDKVADEQEAIGNRTAAEAWRTHEQRAAGLNEEEAAILKQVANDCDQAVKDQDAKLQAESKAFRDRSGQLAPLLKVDRPMELSQLWQDRERIIDARIDELRLRLGQAAFEELDRYIQMTFEPDVKTVPPPSRTPTYVTLTPSIHVSSHSTLGLGLSVLAECHTQMIGLTQDQYISVAPLCTFYHGAASEPAFQCPAAFPTAGCSRTFSVSQGDTFWTKGTHYLNLWRNIYCVNAWGELFPYGDPLHFGAYGPYGDFPGDPFDTPDFLEAGDVMPHGSLICTNGAPVIAYTHSQTLTAPSVTITPDGPEVLPGTKLTFTATAVPSTLAPVTWSAVPPVFGGATIINATTGEFTAPTNAELAGLSATITVKACSVSTPAVCDTTNVLVPAVSITIFGANPLLARAGATQALVASVTGPQIPREVTWTLTGVGSLSDNGFNGQIYTAPAGVTTTTTVQIKACLKDAGDICSTAPLELVAPVVISGIAPGTWPAGQHAPNPTIPVTITGTGFGTSPSVRLSDLQVVFTPDAQQQPGSIKGIVSTPLASAGNLTVTVSSTTDGISSSAASTVLISPPTITAAIAPKSATLQAGQTQQFSATWNCRTGLGSPCVEGPTVQFTASVGSFVGNGLYRAPVSSQTQDLVRVCATWTPGVQACDSATVTLPLLTVTVSPQTVSLPGCQSKTFTAQVTNTTVTTVNWSVTSGGGTIDGSGSYAAPCPVSAAGTATVRVCSTIDTDNTRCGTATVSLTPNLQVASVSVTPTSVQGGNPATGLVTLSGAAPNPGVVVSLTSGDTSRATVPGSIVVAGGLLSETFPIATSSVFPGGRGLPPVAISATYGGVTKSAGLDVQVPIPTVSRPRRTIVVTRIGGGNSFTAQVEMDSAAPAGGLTVGLAITPSSAASVAASVSVAAGATLSAPFTVTTFVVAASTPVTLTATANSGSAPATFYVDPPVYEGYLDGADCSGLVGWAWDANRPNTPITVDIYANGVLQAAGVLANGYRADLVAAGKGNGYHGFGWTVPSSLKNGVTYSMVVKYGGTGTALGATPKSITCTSPTVSVAWVMPAEVTWGPAGTLTVAGYAQNGSGGVTMCWRDATANGVWNCVPFVAPIDATHVWYNTIPTSNNCHTYEVYATYSDATSSVFTYNGLTSGYCHEAARVIWMQPQALAGFGPPGSIVLAGSATGTPSGTLVQVWTRDATAGTGWSWLGASPPDGSGIWYQAIQGANASHVYSAYVTYDVITSATCSYAGNNAQNWCP